MALILIMPCYHFQLEQQQDPTSCQTLRAALSKAESSHPGFTFDLVSALVRKADVSLNMNESLLRLQGNISEQDSE